MAANDPIDRDHYATKGDLDDLHRRINRDVRHALDEALERQSANINLKFQAVDQRFARLEAKLDAKFDAIDERFDALLRDLRSEFKAIHQAIGGD